MSRKTVSSSAKQDSFVPLAEASILDILGSKRIPKSKIYNWVTETDLFTLVADGSFPWRTKDRIKQALLNLNEKQRIESSIIEEQQQYRILWKSYTTSVY